MTPDTVELPVLALEEAARTGETTADVRFTVSAAGNGVWTGYYLLSEDASAVFTAEQLCLDGTRFAYDGAAQTIPLSLAALTAGEQSVGIVLHHAEGNVTSEVLKVTIPAYVQQPVLSEDVLSTAASAETGGDFSYTVNEGTITITGYTGSDAAVTIPAAIDGKPVTAIGEYAFAGCNALKSVELGRGLTTIGENAFRATALTSIVIPNSVTTIDSWAFMYCDKLTSVTFEENSSLTFIGAQAFRETGLTSITIPDMVTVIGTGAFRDCPYLTSVTFGADSQLTSIGNRAFAATGLTSIIVPAGVETIDRFAFEDCKALQTVYLPNRNVQIAEDALNGTTAKIIYLSELTASPEALNFGSAVKGYTAAPDAQTVTIKNTTGRTMTVALPAAANYAIEAGQGFANGTATIAPGGTAAFTVRPRTGLDAGTYRETLTVFDSNNAGAAVDLSFTVEAHTHCVCGGNNGIHTAHGDVDFTPWTSTNSMPNRSGNYVLMNDVTLSNTWDMGWVGSTRLDITLCLNGHTLSYVDSGPSATKDTIRLGSNSTLTLTDCQKEQGRITGVQRAVVWADSGSFTMYGGRITGNVSNHNMMTAGIYGKLYLLGGSIEGNTVSGAAVDAYWDDTVTIGGSIRITGNTKVDGTPSNLRIYEPVHVEPLDSGVVINVAMYTPPGVFTTGNAARYIDRFTSDKSEYIVAAEEGELSLVKIHTITVEIEGNGTASATPASAVAETEITLTAVPDAGYYFANWEVVSGDMTIDNGKFVMPDSDVTVKAVFRAITYTVTYDPNGGTGTVNPDQYVSGSSATVKDGSGLTCIGYVFDGWNTKPDGTGTSYAAGDRIAVTDDILLYAMWTLCDHAGSTAKPGCENSAACSLCGGTIAATGHSWGEVSFTWSEDGSSCTAERVCENDKTHKETAKALVTSEKTKDPTCTEKGETTYTAAFPESWAKTQKKTLANIPALEHDFSDQLTADTDTHYYACSRCDERKGEREHSFRWVTDKKATMTESGLKHEQCKCGAKRNENTVIPPLANASTGDSSPIFLWILVLTVSGAGIAAAALLAAKKQGKFQR